jgi:hypothetical protein
MIAWAEEKGKAWAVSALGLGCELGWLGPGQVWEGEKELGYQRRWAGPRRLRKGISFSIF